MKCHEKEDYRDEYIIDEHNGEFDIFFAPCLIWNKT